MGCVPRCCGVDGWVCGCMATFLMGEGLQTRAWWDGMCRFCYATWKWSGLETRSHRAVKNPSQYPGVEHRMQVIVVLVVRADSCATVAVGVLTSIESADVQCSSRAFAVAVAMIA